MASGVGFQAISLGSFSTAIVNTTSTSVSRGPSVVLFMSGGRPSRIRFNTTVRSRSSRSQTSNKSELVLFIGGSGSSGIPGSPGGTGGGGSGGSEGSNNNNDDVEMVQLLASYGLTKKDMNQQLLQLGTKQVRLYLQAVQNWLTKLLCKFPGFNMRVMADPDLPFKLLMEETLGVGLSATGFILGRGKAILDELDLFFVDISVGATLNFIILYLLTPSIASMVVTAGAKQSFFASLPANAFSKGPYNIGQRAAGLVYKAALFAVCGFMGSMAGTSLARGVLEVKSRLETNEEKRKVLRAKLGNLPDLISNSVGWAAFMVVSTTPRYQLVAGIERALFDLAPGGFAKLMCGAIRTLNNVVGGAHWVAFSKFLGLQPKKN